MLPIIILSGGLATRLRPLTFETPKALIPILGRPFIDWQLEQMRRQGFRKVIISTGYLGSLIQDHVGDGHEYDLEVTYSHDGGSPLGTGGAVYKASRLVKGKFLVTYGDSYLPVSFREFSKVFETSKFESFMAVYKNENQLDSSNIIFEAGKIISYSKLKTSHAYNYIDYGLLGFDGSIFDDLKMDMPWDLSNLLSRLADTGQIGAYLADERFYEIGSFNGIADLENYLKEK